MKPLRSFLMFSTENRPTIVYTGDQPSQKNLDKLDDLQDSFDTALVEEKVTNVDLQPLDTSLIALSVNRVVFLV